MERSIKNYNYSAKVNVSSNIATATFTNINLTKSGTFNITTTFTSENINYESSQNVGNIEVIIPTTTIINDNSSVGYYDKTGTVGVTTNNIPDGSVLTIAGTNISAKVYNNYAEFNGLQYPNADGTNIYTVVFNSNDITIASSTGKITLTSNKYPTHVSTFDVTGYQGETKNITITVSSEGSQLFGTLIVTNIFGNSSTYEINEPNVNITTVNIPNVLLAKIGNFTADIKFISSNVNYLNSTNTGYLHVIGPNLTSMTGFNSIGYYDQKVNVTINTTGIPDGATVYFVSGGVNHTAIVTNGQATFADLSYPNYGAIYNYTVKYDGNIYYAGSSTNIVLKSDRYPTSVTGFTISGYQGEYKNFNVTVSTSGSQLIGTLTIKTVSGKTLTQNINVNNNTYTVAFTEELIGIGDTVANITFNSSNVNYLNSDNFANIHIRGPATTSMTGFTDKRRHLCSEKFNEPVYSQNVCFRICR